jgi:hypothetical protein
MEGDEELQELIRVRRVGWERRGVQVNNDTPDLFLALCFAWCVF